MSGAYGGFVKECLKVVTDPNASFEHKGSKRLVSKK